MKKERIEFLRRLCEAPSPSGFEQPVQRIVKQRLDGLVDELVADVHGNLVAVKNPEAEFKVMLAGHCDEIGLIVKYISDDGYIRVDRIGGVDIATLSAKRVTIHSAKGAVPGLIGKKAIHLEERDQPAKKPKLHELWIDIGARNKKDAERVVAVGDPITIDAPFQLLRNQNVAARGFDDKVGSFVVAETMAELSAAQSEIGIYGVSSVQEELGLRGARTSAYAIDPDVGIAIDVDHASDYPGAEKAQSGEILLGNGPVLCRGANINAVLGELMIKTARQRKIPFQLSAEGLATGTDANAIQISRAGVATALIGIPTRYMHTPGEIVSLKDLDNAIKLLVEVIKRLKSEMDFRPV